MCVHRGVCLGIGATSADDGFYPGSVCAMGGNGKVFEDIEHIVS